MQPDSNIKWAAEFVTGVISGKNAVSPAIAQALDDAYKGVGVYRLPEHYREAFIALAAKRSRIFESVRRVPVKKDTGRLKLPDGSMRGWRVHLLQSQSLIPRALCEGGGNTAIVSAIADAAAHDIDASILLGSGRESPLGLFKDAGIRKFTPDESLRPSHLKTLFKMLPARFHQKAEWILSEGCLGMLWDNRRSGGEGFMEYGSQDFPRILGRPCRVVGGVPDDVMLFGDISKYVWIENGAATIASESASGEMGSGDMIMLNWVDHVDGFPAYTEAFVKAVGYGG